MLASLKHQLWKTGLRHSTLWKLSKIRLNDHRKARALELMRRPYPRTGQIRLLVINHFFDGEIEALARHLDGRNDFSFLSIRPEPFFSRATVWFPERAHRGEIPYDDPGLETVRVRFRSYCERLYHEIADQFPFDCILTPSDSFYWLREFIVVCRQHGIPTLVADKEGTISPRSFEVEPLRIAKMFPPIADHFLVWSERQRRFWINAGVDALRITVVGSMRSDLFVGLRQQEPKTLLCFDFDTNAYITNMDWASINWSGERSWTYLRNAVHRVLLRVARENSQLTVILKCHPQQVVTDFPVPELLTQPNVSIVKGVPRGLPAMIAEAHAIVGFQTTALIEAALAAKTVFYTAWGPLYDLVSSHILPWSKPGYGMTRVHSEQELEQMLRRVVSRDPDEDGPEVDRSNLSHYFHQADGHVTERLLNQVSELLKEHSSCRSG